MNKLNLSICGVLLVTAMIAVAGDLHSQRASITFDSVNGTSNLMATLPPINGYVQEVLVDVVGMTGTTGTVTVAASSPVSTMAARTIATANVAGDTVFIPRFTATQGSTTATTNAAEPFALGGETVTFTVTNIGSVVTSAVYTVFVKYSEAK